MRALTVPVVLTSLALVGWVANATAQEVGNPAQSDQVPALAGAMGNAANTADNPPGTIPQPTPDNPGVVMGVTLGELYTDNLRLAGSGEPKQASWITQVQPFVRAGFRSPLLSGLVDYSLTGYLYTGQAHHAQLAQNLDARGTLTVVPQHLYVEGMAMYGRQVINNALPTGEGTFFLDNNAANVASGTLSPYWVQDLGRVGNMIVRYTLGRVVYNRYGIPDESRNLLAGVPDVTSNGVQWSLTSPQDQTWGWNLGYSEQQLSPDFGQNMQFAVATVGISRQVGPDTRLLADAGKQNNYLPDGTVKHLGAGFWDVGFDWSGALNHLHLLVGHRFFGHSLQFSWTHTAALLTTALGYIEEPTDLNQQLLGQNPGQIAIAPVGITTQFPSLAERRVYLMKRATASASYQMPKGNLTLTLYDESRKYFTLDNEREKVANADLAWRYDLGPFTTLTPSLGWQRYQLLGGQVNYDRYAQLALVHQVNPDNFGSIRLRSDSRNVYAVLPGAHAYRVDVIFVQWTHLF